jgi:membrane-associated phospholipid phosphatase
VLVAEGLARPEVALPLALAIPAVSAGGKLLEEQHWASDVLGGSLAAVVVAATCLAGYERARRR